MSFFLKRPPELILESSEIALSIDYEVATLSQIAQNIVEQSNPNLKQVHVTFSNGGYVFKEALKRLPPEYRDTIIVITTGTTALIENDLAHKVYNIIGDKDWPSIQCNGGLEAIEKEQAQGLSVELIPQIETGGFIGGHYSIQVEYQSHISEKIKDEIKKNMKFINYIIFMSIFIISCSKEKRYTVQTYPPYKLIIEFSEKLHQKTDLILSSYGINCSLPANYKIRNGIGDFRASYSLMKLKDDEISLEYARNLIIFISENFLREINSNPKIKSKLDVYPFTSDLLNMSIYFKDENRIELGQGVASLHFWEGRIKYKGYNIEEYRHHPPAIGKHYTIHEESYQEALDIVKKQGDLIYFDSPKL